MASKFAIMGYFGRLSKLDKKKLDEIITNLISIEIGHKNGERVDDLCDETESLISSFLNKYRK